MVADKDKLILNMQIGRCFDNIIYGTWREIEGFNMAAKYLCCPDKALANLSGKSMPYDEYERAAIDITSLIACSFVYKNKRKFSWNAQKKNYTDCLLEYMYKNKVVEKGCVTKKFICKDYDKMNKWIYNFCFQQLPPHYTINSAFKHYEIDYMRLVENYEQGTKITFWGNLGRPHPYLLHYASDVGTKIGSVKFQIAVKKMLDGMYEGKM